MQLPKEECIVNWQELKMQRKQSLAPSSFWKLTGPMVTCTFVDVTINYAKLSVGSKYGVLTLTGVVPDRRTTGYQVQISSNTP